MNLPAALLLAAPTLLFATPNLILQDGRVLLSVSEQETGKNYLIASQITAASPSEQSRVWQTLFFNVRLEKEGSGYVLHRLRGVDHIRLDTVKPGVCDITRLIGGEIRELSFRTFLGAQGLDEGASRITRVYNFADRVEADVTQELIFRDGHRTVGLRFTLMGLPDQPLDPLVAGQGVGHSLSNVSLLGTPAGPVLARRRRLERGKPVVYWIDPATPRAWIQYVKQGIEDWEPLFRAAGFPNGIQARLSGRNEPPRSPSRSVYFHWVKDPFVDTFATSPVDSRSGEMFLSNIVFHEGAIRQLSNNYFVRLAAVDNEARAYPPSQATIGRMIRMRVSHEVGHTLGLSHNSAGAAGYAARNLRDGAWLKRMGFTPTIMGYAGFNYVAQPEDHIERGLLFTRIGPADRWTFNWLYGSRSGDWAAEQERSPWLRAELPFDANDLEEQVQDRLGDIGTQDPTWSAEMGEGNLKRTVPLIPANADEALRRTIIRQWMNYMMSVAAIPGGRRLKAAIPERRYERPSRDEQLSAIRFLSDRVFRTPVFLLATDERSAASARLKAAQRAVLGTLVDAKRIGQMSGPDAPVPAEEMLAMIGDALFAAGADEFRSELQRLFIEMLASRSWPSAKTQVTRLLPLAPELLATRMKDLLEGRIKAEPINHRPAQGVLSDR